MGPFVVVFSQLLFMSAPLLVAAVGCGVQFHCVDNDSHVVRM